MEKMSFQKSKNVLLVYLFCIVFISNNYGQCTGGSAFGTLSPTQNWQTYSLGYGGEYQTFTAIAGATYEFSYCSADGGSSPYDTEITLQNSNGTPLAYNDQFCGNQSRLTWTAPSAGTYRAYTTEYSCMPNSIASTLAYRILSQPNPNSDVFLSASYYGSNYLRIPLAQVQSQTFSGEVTNGSNSTANGFGLKVDVINASNNSIIQTFTSGLSNVPAGTVQSFNNVGSWLPTSVGSYRIRYSALASSQNGNASNDTSSYLLHVTDTVYGRDNNIPSGSISLGSTTPPLPGEFGVNYQLYAPANLTSIGIRVNNSSGTATGTVLNVILRNANPNGMPGSVIDTCVPFVVGSGLNGWVNLPLRSGAVNLSPGKIYVGVAEGNQPIPISYFSNIFSLNTNWLNAPNLTTGWQTFESFQVFNTLGMRLNIGVPCPVINPNLSITQPNCNQPLGNITTNPTGGNGPYTYLWSNGAATSTLTGVPAGSYVVTITDVASGCSVIDTATLSPINNPVVTSLNIIDALCFGQNGQITATISGGTPPYSYLWSNGSTNDTLIAGVGVYSLVITDAAGCIDSTAKFPLLAPASPLALSVVNIVNATDSASSNGTAQLIATGGTPPYSFSGINMTVAGDYCLNMSPGSYTAVVTDANGCTDTLIFSVGSALFITNHNPSFSVYPNPANDLVNIDLTYLNGITHIRLLDTKGIEWYVNKILGGEVVSLPLKNVPAGIYLLEVSNGDYLALKRIVVVP